MCPMLAAVLLASLVAAPIALPAPSNAIVVIPDQPGTTVLPDAPTLQALVADLDGDGRRELIRLVRGDDDAALVEVWGLVAGDWRLVDEAVEVVPPARIGIRIDPVYSAAPVRLLVRRVGAVEHVTVASQPHFEEIDVGPPCCLLLNDLVLSDGALSRVEVAEPSDFADSILVIDLDGDETDELLVTRNLPPLGDISFPIAARVHRWSGDRFAGPAVTELPVGSGDAPFVLGDSDGLPGEEAAITSTLGPSGLFRIRLTPPGDRLVIESAGFPADQAVAVPIEGGRGVAAFGRSIGVRVAEWPAGATAAGPPLAESFISAPRLVGTVVVSGVPRLVIYQPATSALHLLSLPDLLPPQGLTVTRSPAAAALSAGPMPAYVGPLPGGGPNGQAAIIHSGRLIPSAGDPGRAGTALMATLAGAQPIGLVGDRDQLAILHAPVGPGGFGASGGPLTVPAVLPLAWTTIAPFELSRQPESDDGRFEPSVAGALPVDARSGIAVGAAGFRVEILAPAGSRVIAADVDPSVGGTPIVIPRVGRREVVMRAPPGFTPDARYRATLVVSTPAGHAYIAAWDVQLRTGPPPLTVRTSTPIGSLDVQVAGVTRRDASVRIAGEPVTVDADGRFATAVAVPPWPTQIAVEVDDGLGNVRSSAVTAVGIFDYRGLPWVPIVVVLVALAAAALFLRVPRVSPLPRRAEDDARLEELEPD
jgi:hypothetical protein